MNYDLSALKVETNSGGFILGESLLGDALADDSHSWVDVLGDFSSIAVKRNASVENTFWKPNTATLTLSTAVDTYISGQYGRVLRLVYGGTVLFQGIVSEVTFSKDTEQANGYARVKTQVQIQATGRILELSGNRLNGYASASETTGKRARDVATALKFPLSLYNCTRQMVAREAGDPSALEVLQECANTQLARFFTTAKDELVIDARTPPGPALYFTDQPNPTIVTEYNLVKNPTFNTGIGTWVTGTDYRIEGGRLVTVDTDFAESATPGTTQYSAIADRFGPVAAGTYTVGFTIKDSGNNSTIKTVDVKNGSTSAVYGSQAFSTSPGIDTDVSMTVTIPSNVTTVRLSIYGSRTVGYPEIEYDNIFMVTGAGKSYFDGDSLNAYWTGARGNSVSARGSKVALDYNSLDGAESIEHVVTGITASNGIATDTLKHPQAIVSADIAIETQAADLDLFTSSFPLQGSARLAPTGLTAPWSDEIAMLELTDLIRVSEGGSEYDAAVSGIGYSITPYRWNVSLDLVPGYLSQPVDFTRPSPVRMIKRDLTNTYIGWAPPATPGSMTGYLVRYRAGNVPPNWEEGTQVYSGPNRSVSGLARGAYSVWAVTADPNVYSERVTIIL